MANSNVISELISTVEKVATSEETKFEPCPDCGSTHHRACPEPIEIDLEPSHDDTVLYCPECERPNQFGELCPSCQRETELEAFNDAE